MAEHRYVFAPLETRGMIAGIRGGQLALVGGGLLVAVGIVRADAGVAGFAAAIVVVLVACALAFVDVGGRSAEQWVPLAAHHALARLVGGLHARPDPQRCPPVTMPSWLSGIRFSSMAGPPGSEPAAVIVDRRTGVLAGVLAVRGRGIALLDPEDKERRLAAWGGVLAALAREGGAVRRLQWVLRTAGGDATALVRHFEARRGQVAGHGSSASALSATASYAELIAEAGPLTEQHECFCVLAVRAQAGVGVLGRELRLLEGQLRHAEIEVIGQLGPRALAGALRAAVDPGGRRALARRASDAPECGGSAWDAAWPSATETSWSSYHTDAAWHATFWVAEWPRTEVGPDFLAPMLLATEGQRSVSVVMAPVPAREGFREAEAARTAAAADEELRRRAGFLGTARRQREAEGLAKREAELADGHVAYRFSAYVTVTAAGPQALEDACAATVQVAHQCRLDLRRLYGAQDVGFSWTLPLARGLA